MLSKEQIAAYHQKGYLKVKQLFTPEESAELGSEMVRVIEQWGEESIGWIGPWRDRYLPEDERLNTRAVFMHNPHFYSSAWGRVIFHDRLVGCVKQLVGSNVQWHHTVLHAKPPERGTPFPMHQDYPFYPHDGLNFIDCLAHLDDTPTESGCLCIVPESHKNGPLEHILGKDTAPHLPPDDYHPNIIETESIPAEKGDVIFFNYCSIHWSDCNRTDQWRKSVRFGYHDTRLRPVAKVGTGKENDPIRIDPNNILETNHNIVVSGFKQNNRNLTTE